MKLMIVLLSLLSALSTQAATSAENFRCWSDPGFFGVIKIDVIENLICVTGFDGQNYDCNEKAVVITPLISTTESEVDFFGETIQAKTFHAQSTDKVQNAILTVYLKDYPRPYFPEFKISPADLVLSEPFLPYSYKWQSQPQGEIIDDQLYCLSEKYFIK